jgi:YidC/Oxa1 family membrane protein insertase
MPPLEPRRRRPRPTEAHRMNFLTAPWDAIKDGLTSALDLLHSGLEPLFGVHAWGWAIIALTILVRVALLPLAIKQTRSMRAMQSIQPKVKAIQAKYKVDKELQRKDPETYQKKKAEQNEALMALYKEEGANPAASCLPLVLQMPIFFALFTILNPARGGAVELATAKFYFFTSGVTEKVGSLDGDMVANLPESVKEQILGLGAGVSAAGIPGYMLIVAMSATMFITQKQMMSRNAVEGPAAMQQKIMMYVFPIFLAFISLNFPLAVVLYWVTTNLWQGVQQYVMFRAVSDDDAPSAGDRPARGSDPKPSPSGPKSRPDTDTSGSSKGKPQGQSKGQKGAGSASKSHLPKKKTT